jgi:hypothetical protein
MRHQLSEVDALVESLLARSRVAMGGSHRVKFEAPGENSIEAPVVGAFEGLERVVDE